MAFFDTLVLEQSKVNINLPAKLGHIISYYIKVIYTDMPNRDLFYESKLQTFTRDLYCLKTIKIENKSWTVSITLPVEIRNKSLFTFDFLHVSESIRVAKSRPTIKPVTILK